MKLCVTATHPLAAAAVSFFVLAPFSTPLPPFSPPTTFLEAGFPKKDLRRRVKAGSIVRPEPGSWSTSLTLSTSGTSSRPQRSMPSAETSASSRNGSKRRRGQRAARRRQQLCVVEFQKLKSISRHLVLTMTTSPNARALKRPLSENF